MSDLMASLVQLSPAEKLDLIGELWDDLSTRTENVPLTEAQKEELDRRKEHLQRDPSSALTWEEIVQRVKQKHAT